MHNVDGAAIVLKYGTLKTKTLQCTYECINITIYDLITGS